MLNPRYREHGPNSRCPKMTTYLTAREDGPGSVRGRQQRRVAGGPGRRVKWAVTV